MQHDDRDEGVTIELRALVEWLRKPDSEMVEVIARTQCSEYGYRDPNVRITFDGNIVSRWELYKPMAVAVMQVIADVIEEAASGIEK